MKLIFSALVLVAVTMILTMAVQPAFAPRGCSGCGEFLKLTAQFERDVGQSILEFAVENQPNNAQAYSEFKKLTAQFKTDVINAVLVGNPDTNRILAGLLETYQGKILDLRLGEEVAKQVPGFHPFVPFSDF